MCSDLKCHLNIHTSRSIVGLYIGIVNSIIFGDTLLRLDDKTRSGLVQVLVGL